MTDPLEKAATLRECPYCGAEMLVRTHSAFHPVKTISEGQCWLQFAGEYASTYELHERDYAAWNRRASPPPAAAPEIEPKRIYQTELGSRGNCQSACIAMMLNLDIAEVPNFWAGSASDEDWRSAMASWLEARGLQLITIMRWPIRGFYIAGGVSPRDPNTGHAVIYKDGELWHDPHPDGLGLAAWETSDLILPVAFSSAAALTAASATMEKKVESAQQARDGFHRLYSEACGELDAIINALGANDSDAPVVNGVIALQQSLATARAEVEVILDLGRECTVQISGDPDDAVDITTVDIAWLAIREALRLGTERNNERNALQAEVESLKGSLAEADAVLHGLMREPDGVVQPYRLEEALRRHAARTAAKDKGAP